MAPARKKYAETLLLHKTTDMTLAANSREGHIAVSLSAYLRRCHSDQMSRCHGLTPPKDDAAARIWKNRGQRPETHKKYKEAIEACDSEKYIDRNVSEIARIFGLDPSAMSRQLRVHYPEIIIRREYERSRRGIADNYHRGARSVTKETYAPAIALLKDPDVTVEEAADACNVSYSGLKEHMLHYHKDLVGQRRQRRDEGKKTPETAGEMPRSAPKRYSTETARKYGPAIRSLRESGATVKAVARKFGINADVFRRYLKEHEPELWESLGMITLPNGREVLKRSYERYAEAIELYTATGETLKSISGRLGLQYNSLSSFIRRNFPEAIAARSAGRKQPASRSDDI